MLNPEKILMQKAIVTKNKIKDKVMILLNIIQVKKIKVLIAEARNKIF